jgi:hypothetical protein
LSVDDLAQFLRSLVRDPMAGRRGGNGEVQFRSNRTANANFTSACEFLRFAALRGLADYLVPVNADVPQLDATFLDTEDMIADPIGAKGLGEIVIVGVPAAIANAVFNATGKRITDLPITLDMLL